MKIFNSDKFLLAALVVVLISHYARIFPFGLDDLILAIFAVIATVPVFLSAYGALKNKKISVDLLASVALIVSLLNKEWASATFINLMLTSARIFAEYTENNTRFAIKSLLKLRPEKVKVKKGKEIVEEPVSSIKIDDLVVIELGDRIPVDGIVINGQALIDQSSLTGESLPVVKNVGDEVLSSTLNISGSMIIRAEKVGKDTMFERVVGLVEQSQRGKTAIQTMAEKFTGYYIIATLLGALILSFISHNPSLVLAVLLVTCADDIAVAIPMAFSAALGNAAKRGIIIKGGSFLEGLTKIKTLIVDKTGTITSGKLKVKEVVSFGSSTEEELLKFAAMADFFSGHPIAKAIINRANQKKLEFEKPSEFEEFAGKGSTAVYNGKKIIFGKLSLLRELGVKTTKEELEKIEHIEQEGLCSLLSLGYDGRLMGYIALTDELRPETKGAIEKLRNMGVEKVVMLTGDNEKVAKKVSEDAGIGIFHSNLLPEDKTNYVKKYLNKDSKVAMVGDGINDAASLALADIGIAMGVTGSDAAIEAADIALMKDDFSKIPEAIEIGNSAVKIAGQNFLIWAVVNAVGLVLVFGKIIGPEGAAAFNFITDFFPILNSTRLFEYKYFSFKK